MRLIICIVIFLGVIPTFAQQNHICEKSIITLLQKHKADSIKVEVFWPTNIEGDLTVTLAKDYRRPFYATFENDSVTNIVVGKNFIPIFLSGLSDLFLSKNNRIYKSRKKVNYEIFSDGDTMLDVIIYRNKLVKKKRYFFGDYNYNGSVDVQDYNEEYTDELRQFMKLLERNVETNLRK